MKVPTIAGVVRRLRAVAAPGYQRSYAQCGEDVLVSFLARNLLGIAKPTYLDIGAHHPTLLSNTYYFYRSGCSGVCVEPDPALWAGIKRKRGRDVCLNVGIGDRRETKELYVLGSPDLNTFSGSQKDLVEEKGAVKVSKVIRVELVPVNEVMAQYFRPWPNFVSLDAEGMDLTILRGTDFKTYRPEVFCIETLSFTSQEKLPEITEFMTSVGYMVYADTYINTVYVERGAWERRAR
jgi:FkbM family methyltransferase